MSKGGWMIISQNQGRRYSDSQPGAPGHETIDDAHRAELHWHELGKRARHTPDTLPLPTRNTNALKGLLYR